MKIEKQFPRANYLFLLVGNLKKGPNDGVIKCEVTLPGSPLLTRKSCHAGL